MFACFASRGGDACISHIGALVVISGLPVLMWSSEFNMEEYKGAEVHSRDLTENHISHKRALLGRPDNALFGSHLVCKWASTSPKPESMHDSSKA